MQLKTYILKNFHFEGVLRFVIEYAWTHTSTVTRIYLSRSLGLFFSSRRNRFYRIISCAYHRVNQLTRGRNNHKNSWRDTSYLGKSPSSRPRSFLSRRDLAEGSVRARLSRRRLFYLGEVSFISPRSLWHFKVRRDLAYPGYKRFFSRAARISGVGRRPTHLRL